MKRLKEAQDELVKKGRMEQLGQLTATVAHELRNPLGAVRTSAFLLERKIKGKGLDVEAQIERINKGIVRCDNIITQLLDFSSAHRLLQVLVDLVEEAGGRQPGLVGPISSARSLVMCRPRPSHRTFSSVSAKRASSALSSSLARWARPRVQAKIEAIELVEVSLPCWCWR
jgi:signal transduction histidine kinase